MRLLDTDVCIEIIRGNEGAMEHRAECEDEVAATWITAGELFYGAAKSKAPHVNRLVVVDFLATLPIVEIDAETAAVFGETKARLERQGQRLADADLWIAASTLAHGASLVTGNIKHYDRIDGLHIENWIR